MGGLRQVTIGRRTEEHGKIPSANHQAPENIQDSKGEFNAEAQRGEDAKGMR
jgi:hypothetical protein